MNNLKFRAWQISKQKWVNVDSMLFNRSKFYGLYCVDIDDEILSDDLIIEQFTGMQDINGVDIYVGDVLTFTDFDFLLDADDTSTLVIEFKNGCFIAEYLGYTIEGLLSGFIVDDIANPFREKTEKAKIIGNIHENPEILESIEAEL